MLLLIDPTYPKTFVVERSDFQLLDQLDAHLLILLVAIGVLCA
jgi:hypothetical protein